MSIVTPKQNHYGSCTYNPVTQAALSESTIQFFKNYYIDKAFISVLGIDLDFGASIPSMSDAIVKNPFLIVQTKNLYGRPHKI